MPVRHAAIKAAALLRIVLFPAGVWAQQPVTGYAPVNGLEMYYEIHGKVIAVEMQGHGRTADIDRDFSYDNLADDVAALLDYRKIGKTDIIGYSMGGGVALNMAIRHPDHVRKVVSISAVFRDNGWVQEALDAYPHFTADAFKASPIEAEYKKLSPTPNEFPNFVKRAISMDLQPYDFGAEKLKATPAPIFFIHGDADGVRLELMQKIDVIAPLINDFLAVNQATK